MKATILRVCQCHLVVCDLCTCQEVVVHTPCACRFCRGETVCIRFNGAMTASIPPQITALTRPGPLRPVKTQIPSDAQSTG